MKNKIIIAAVFIALAFSGISCSDNEKNINVNEADKNEAIELGKIRSEKQKKADSLKAEIEKLKQKRDSLKQETNRVK